MTEYLPPPDPSRFPTLRPLHLREIGTDVMLGRIYLAAGQHPAAWNTFRTFGPTGSRFDHHPGAPGDHPNYGIIYLAPALIDARGNPTSALQTALLECFRDTGVVDTITGAPHFVLFRTTRALRLLDLADSDWVTEAGANGAISSGPRDAARAWARTIHHHYGTQIDGLIYPSSNRPPARAIALWEHGRDAIPPRPAFHEPLNHISLRAALETFAAAANLGLRLPN